MLVIDSDLQLFVRVCAEILRLKWTARVLSLIINEGACPTSLATWLVDSSTRSWVLSLTIGIGFEAVDVVSALFDKTLWSLLINLSLWRDKIRYRTLNLVLWMAASLSGNATSLIGNAWVTRMRLWRAQIDELIWCDSRVTDNKLFLSAR